MQTRIVFLGILCFSFSSCAAVGNFFVPKHSKSDYQEPELSCIYLEEIASKTEALPLLTAAASVAAGILVDRVAKAVEKEGERYKASYSARVRDKFYKISPDMFGNDQKKRTFNTIRFVRFQGDNLSTLTEKGEKVSKSCEDLQTVMSTAENTAIAMELILDVSLDEDAEAYEIKPSNLTIKKTKAKVKSWKGYMPWSWWMWFDSSQGKVDLKASVTLSAIGKSKEGLEPVDVIAVDIPLGKRDLNEKIINVDIKDGTSGWFIMPAVQNKLDLLPVTVSVTVSESDEIGDVIGNAAKQISENKKQITNVILDSLKLRATE